MRTRHPMYYGNPDFASKRLHYVPKTDGRCHVNKIANLETFWDLREVDRKKYPKENDCFWCIRKHLK